MSIETSMRIDCTDLRKLAVCVRHKSPIKYPDGADFNRCDNCLRLVVYHVAAEAAKLAMDESINCQKRCGRKISYNIIKLAKRER